MASTTGQTSAGQAERAVTTDVQPDGSKTSPSELVPIASARGATPKRKPRQQSTRTRVAATALAGHAVDFPGRTASAATALGGVGKIADLLDVSRSQPTRWRQGVERPSPEMARLVVDLDHVMARAQLVFTPEVARRWLTGANSYLEGARPIDVLRRRGSSEVIDALDAAMQGAYS